MERPINTNIVFKFVGINNGNHGKDSIEVEPTSYDYDGLISESGDLTKKYFAMKKIIGKYLPIPNIPVEAIVPKGNYGSIEMTHVIDVFSLRNTPLIPHLNKMNTSDHPMTFEQLDQENGFMLYEHVIVQSFRDPSNLTVTGNEALSALCAILSNANFVNISASYTVFMMTWI